MPGNPKEFYHESHRPAHFLRFIKSEEGEEEEEEVADSEDDLVPEPEQQQAAPPEEKAADGEDWFKAMRDALDDGKVVEAPSVAPLSSSSDSTAPIRYRWERAEDEAS